mgnify:CR=1 FL=1
MKLIVGLGNPGKEYEGTRHNMGYDVLDKFSDLVGGDFSRNEFQGVFGIVNNPSLKEKIIIAKPETFMNLSGKFVSQLLSYFKIPTDDLIVVYDDMALKEGSIRLRPDGSSGGQKGMENIIKCLATENIKRIRVGIGEPKYDAVKHVLGVPTGEEKTKIDSAIDRATKAIREFLINDFQNAMSKFNGGGNSWMMNS